MSEARIIPLHADESGGRTRWRLNAAAKPRTPAPPPVPEPEPEPERHRPVLGGGASPSCCSSCAGGWRATTPVDDFGFDADLTDNVILPVLRPLYEKWFRTEAIGLHNVPDVGGALVVANHSGTLPLDALMTAVALHDDHPGRRHLRMLGADFMFKFPGVGPLARKHGATLACNPDAERLMSDGRARRACGRRGSRASASRSATATSCSASAAAASSRPRCAPGCRSSRARSSAPRRSTRRSATSSRWPACSAPPTSRSRRRSRCSARSGWCRCRRSG